VHGIGRRGADDALNRARGIALVCGPTRGGAWTQSRGPPELDPGSFARRGGGARKRMTGGLRPSATGGGARGDSGNGPRWARMFS
jgi:hypothetical protein